MGGGDITAHYCRHTNHQCHGHTACSITILPCLHLTDKVEPLFKKHLKHETKVVLDSCERGGLVKVSFTWE